MNENTFAGLLLVSDMDGTLLDSHNRISRENRGALRRFVAEGGLFTVATGRTESSVARYLDCLPVNVPAILYNGGLIYDFPARKALWKVLLSGAAVTLVQTIWRGFPGLGLEVYHKGLVYIVAENAVAARHLRKEKLAFEYASAPSDIPGPWQKVLLAGEPPEIDQVLSFLRRERLPFTFVRSEPYFLEILPPDTSKGAALRLLRKHLSIPSSRVVAVGDNPNDKEMLEAAGFGIAVGNAHRELKKVAGFCSVCHDQHAVAEVVNWIEQNVAHMITGESKDEIRISGNQAGPRNEDSDRSLQDR